VRVERSRLHRQLKEGSLGYEDEKISWLVASKNPRNYKGLRLLNAPRTNKAEVLAMACGPSGLCELRIPARQKQAYKQAKKWHWGDVVDGGKDLG
jgi:ribosomal protein RSM22 (predicted rRNA methylase)